MNKKTLGLMALAFCLGLTPAISTIVSNNEAENTASTEQTSNRTPGGPVDLSYAAERAVNSVVYIKVTTHSRVQQAPSGYRDPFEDFFNEFFGRGGSGSQRRYESPERKGAGSGVIISADGYIVTNNHVVEGADELQVKLNDNREFKARIIGTDKNTDLALIKVEAEDLPAITIGDSNDLKLGEWVLAIGNPFSLTSTVTAGIISAKARTLGAGANSIESFIQTDAAINPGNSGGALVNTRGELIGINAMIYSQTGSYSGYGFAIPTTIMRKVVDDLKEFGTVQRAMLGVIGKDVSVYLDEQHEKGNNVDLGTLTGVYVNDVSQDGAAAQGGLQKGDVIIAIDGNTIEKFGQLQELMAGHRPGDKVEVTYLRNKKKHTTRLTLRNVQGTEGVVESIGGDKMGAALRPLSDTEKQQLALRHGLMVTAVKNGKMSEAGITKGIIIMQVNDREMHTVADFDDAVRAANMSTDRVLWIRAKTQSGINRSYTVELSDNANLKNKK